ncbi:MAG: 1-acyl-sn-glycerol-3-phosphate acyltransferase [Gammaproteobacteria bacterium]|nr:1-acyl-sn-glycerol-3-phosphate acyltransferase [Gammaproteobacteria bacterium]
MAAGLRAQARRLWRLAWVLLLVPVSVAEAVFLAIVDALAPRLRRRIQPPMMRAWCGWLALLWGIRISVQGEPVAAPAMLACNHRSWLDIVVLGATIHGSFISKAELDRWPVVGYLARHGGSTLYISRGEMRSFRQLGGNLVARLNESTRIIFFPEGGISGDRLLLRFRPRLFAAAIAARCAVQPVAIEYCGGDGADQAPMGATEPFALHAWRLLRYRRIEVRTTFLDPLDPHGRDEKALAAQAQAAVAGVLSPASPRGGKTFADTLGAAERGLRGEGSDINGKKGAGV